MTAPAGLVAAFADAERLCTAVRRLREVGYARLDAFTPFPIPEVSDALGERGSLIPWIAGGSALVGVGVMLVVQWWASGAAYPLNIGGRPTLPWPAFVSTTVIVAILWAAAGTFAGLLWLTGLPCLHHAVFDVPDFAALWEGRFFLMVEARDPRFDAAATRALLEALAADSVRTVPA